MEKLFHGKRWLSFMMLKLPVIHYFKICNVKRTELPRRECLTAQLICIAVLFVMPARFSTILERPNRLFRLSGAKIRFGNSIIFFRYFFFFKPLAKWISWLDGTFLAWVFLSGNHTGLGFEKLSETLQQRLGGKEILTPISLGSTWCIIEWLLLSKQDYS